MDSMIRGRNSEGKSRFVLVDDDEIPFWRVDYNTGKVTVLYDLSPQVTLDSTWPVLDVNKQYDFSESQGCVIQKVEYEKGGVKDYVSGSNPKSERRCFRVP